MKNKEIYNIYLLGKKLGLDKRDINKAISNSNKKSEQATFSCGPWQYHGGRYGTVSIRDFII